MKTANNLCADIGYLSINHTGEQLCGDHVEIVEPEDGDSTIVVLADGLGSGVKASILSTLTSKILSTMLAAGLKLEDAVETLVETLPVCSIRQIAYSTFTIVRIANNRRVEIIQYDNPRVIMLRDGKSVDIPFRESYIGDKKVIKAEIDVQEHDTFLAFTDGVEHAGIGLSYNFGWKREDIIDYITAFWNVGYTAKTLSTILIGETNRLRSPRCAPEKGPRRQARRRCDRMHNTDTPPRTREPYNRPAVQQGRLQQDDVFVLRKGGQAHSMRRNHKHHCRRILEKAAEAEP